MIIGISRQSGATLVELVMTIVIISIAVAGVVGAFATIAGRSADPLNETRAVELAQLYLDEILTKKYDEGTPEGGVPVYSGSCRVGVDGSSESRGTFDDVDDYNKLEESPANILTSSVGYNGFTVSVAITCAGAEIGVPDAKRIDVTIAPPTGQDFLFTAYRVNY